MIPSHSKYFRLTHTRLIVKSWKELRWTKLTKQILWCFSLFITFYFIILFQFLHYPQLCPLIPLLSPFIWELSSLDTQGYIGYSTFLPLSCKVTQKFWILVFNKAICTKHFPCGIVVHTESLIILPAFWFKYFQTAKIWNLPSTHCKMTKKTT